MELAYCTSCRCKTPYLIHDVFTNVVIHDVRFQYLDKCCNCCKCGNKVYVPKIHDENVEAEITSYNKARGGIKL